MANITCTLYSVNYFIKRPNAVWLSAFLLCEIPTYLFLMYSYLKGKELKYVLYPPAILMTVRL